MIRGELIWLRQDSTYRVWEVGVPYSVHGDCGNGYSADKYILSGFTLNDTFEEVQVFWVKTHMVCIALYDPGQADRAMARGFLREPGLSSPGGEQDDWTGPKSLGGYATISQCFNYQPVLFLLTATLFASA